MMVQMQMMMMTGNLTEKKWIVYCRPGKPGTRQRKHVVFGGFLAAEPDTAVNTTVTSTVAITMPITVTMAVIITVTINVTITVTMSVPVTVNLYSDHDFWRVR